MVDTDSRNPFKTKSFAIGAVVVGALALAGIVLGVTSLGAGGGDDTAATPGTPTASSTISAEAVSVCGLAGYETTSSLASAPSTEWSIVGTVAAPSDPAIGPGVTGDDGIRSCYSHTAAGALFAVANWWALGTDARTARAAIEQLAEPGPGRDAALENSSESSNNGLSAQIAGYKVLSYTDTAATIDLAWQTNTGQLVSVPAAVVWLDGDWKVASADDGTSPFPPAALQNLGGYTAWSGV